ncbi:hypothetical protein F5887DRAFT_880618, partial [Amanita rubescens]
NSTQLYHDKESECWFFIWVILNLSIDQHYKKRFVLPGGLKPKNMELACC